MWYSTSQCLIFSLVCSVYATEIIKPGNAASVKRQEMGPMGEEMGKPMPEMPMPEMAMPAKEPSAANGTTPAKGEKTATIVKPEGAGAAAAASVPEATMPAVMPAAGAAGGLKPAAIVKTNDAAGGPMALASGGAPVGSANATARATAKATLSEPKTSATMPKITAASAAEPKGTGGLSSPKGNTTGKASAASVAGVAGATGGTGTRTLAAIMRTTISGVKNTYYTAPPSTPTPEAVAPAVKGAALTTPNIVKAQASGGLGNSTSGNGTSGVQPNNAEHGSTTGNMMFSGAVTLAIAIFLL